ncbi:MAG: hypothetical protein J1F12_04510 [Muribaculaceae bacterium]|nr:hypothetical protein [Muribaculaceae bacterium]
MTEKEEDYKLQMIFRESSDKIILDKGFISRLEGGIRAIDLVMEQKKRIQNKIRITALVSVLIGFASGVLMSLLYPYIYIFTETSLMKLMKPENNLLVGVDVTTYCLISCVCILVSIFSYIGLLNMQNIKTGFMES